MIDTTLVSIVRILNLFGATINLSALIRYGQLVFLLWLLLFIGCAFAFEILRRNWEKGSDDND